jgi:hypothetical protein
MQACQVVSAKQQVDATTFRNNNAQQQISLSGGKVTKKISVG